MARNCPDCSVEMRVETVHQVRLDVCPDCAGIWFDPEELRTLLAWDPLTLSELKDRTFPPVEQKHIGPSIRHCPDNQFPLEERHYLYTSPVLLEVCAECGGFFVKADQLGQMQQWLDQCHRPMSKEEEDRLAVAQATITHDDEMLRQKNLLHFFTMLRQYRPGWIGLLS